jgi:cytochrome c-type biogenesis protein CcmH/NrfG
MYTIQINHDDYPAELSPACEVFTSAHVSEAAAVWQFMIDNLRPG